MAVLACGMHSEVLSVKMSVKKVLTGFCHTGE